MKKCRMDRRQYKILNSTMSFLSSKLIILIFVFMLNFTIYCLIKHDKTIQLMFFFQSFGKTKFLSHGQYSYDGVLQVKLNILP